MSIQSVSIQANTGQEYLNQLLTCSKSRWKKASGSVLTEQAQTCLKQIKQCKSKEIWLEREKFVAIYSAWIGSLLSVPVAGSLGIYGYCKFKQLVADETSSINQYGFTTAANRISEYATPMLTPVYKAFTGALDDFYKVVSTELTTKYQTHVAGALGSLGTLLAVDLLRGKNSIMFTGIKGVLAATLVTYMQMAKKNSDLVEKWFIEGQKECKQKGQVAHDLAFKHKKRLFELVAVALVETSQVEDPAQLFKCQKNIEELNKNLSVIKADLASLTLTDAEIGDILGPLTESMKLIQNQKFSLKEGTDVSDYGYNARIIAGLPLAKNTCIPAKALNNIEMAKANQLGIGHTFKKLGASLATGLGTVAAVPGIAFVAASQYAPAQLAVVKGVLSEPNNYKNLFNNTGLVVAGVAVTALGAGAGFAKVVANRWTKEAKENAAFVKERFDDAKKEICDLYSGIATYFYLENEKPGSKAELQALAKQVNDKLPGINKMIDKSGIKVTGQQATQPLRDILKTIVA